MRCAPHHAEDCQNEICLMVKRIASPVVSAPTCRCGKVLEDAIHKPAYHADHAFQPAGALLAGVKLTGQDGVTAPPAARPASGPSGSDPGTDQTPATDIAEARAALCEWALQRMEEEKARADLAESELKELGAVFDEQNARFSRDYIAITEQLEERTDNVKHYRNERDRLRGELEVMTKVADEQSYILNEQRAELDAPKRKAAREFLPWKDAFVEFWRNRERYCSEPETEKDYAECAYFNGYLKGAEWAAQEVRAAKGRKGKS